MQEQMITVMEEKDDEVFVQINNRSEVGTDVPGRNAWVKVPKGKTKEEAILAKFPGSRINTIEETNDEIVEILVDKGLREWVEVIGPTPNDPIVRTLMTPEEAAAYRLKLEQEAEAAQAAQEPVSEGTPE